MSERDELNKHVEEQIKAATESKHPSADNPLGEESLRRDEPPFHQGKEIEKYHSWLDLKQKSRCDFCNWKSSTIFKEAIIPAVSFNGFSDEELMGELEGDAIYGSWAKLREKRVNAYFRGRELGWSHQKLASIMGRRLNERTLEDYAKVYDYWVASKMSKPAK